MNNLSNSILDKMYVVCFQLKNGERKEEKKIETDMFFIKYSVYAI